VTHPGSGPLGGGRNPAGRNPAGRNDAGDPPDGFVAVGRIGAPRGVRGEVFVEPWTDAPEERFAPGAVLRTREGGLTVAASSLAGGKLVVRFTGAADRPSAERLRRIELFVPATERPPLEDPDEFYDSDLVGLAVEHVDGTPIGTVRAVTHSAASPHLVVDVRGRDCLVPFVAAIVPAVDLADGRVVVDPPEGLFDL
jgi:16S rRNA processing protein RimM